MGTGSFPGVKRPGRGADHHPHLQCRGLKKGRAIPLPTLRALVACKGGSSTLPFPSLREENSLAMLSSGRIFTKYEINIRRYKLPQAFFIISSKNTTVIVI
jgi:hypothetical protein